MIFFGQYSFSSLYAKLYSVLYARQALRNFENSQQSYHIPVTSLNHIRTQQFVRVPNVKLTSKACQTMIFKKTKKKPKARQVKLASYLCRAVDGVDASRRR